MAVKALELEVEADRLKQSYATSDSSFVESMAPGWLAMLGIEVSAADPLRPALTRELVKARLRATQARQARHSGELVDTPQQPELQALAAIADRAGLDLAPADKPTHLLTLRDVFELWKTKSETPSAKSIDTALRVVEAFELVTGNPPLQRLTWK